MHKRDVTAALVAGATVLASAMAVSSSAQAAVTPHAVPNTKPAWTAHAKHLGAASSKATVSARVYLAPKGGVAALKAEALAVSTPGSKSYRHFLSKSQYQARFGITSASAKSVEKWLRASGLTVTSVGSANRYVAFRGTVKAAEKAFGAQIERYTHNGKSVQAPAGALKVPSGLAVSVLTISGLDTTPRMSAPASAKSAPPSGFRNARPCSLYYDQIKAKTQADFTTPLPTFEDATVSYAPCGYTGPQFRAAYEGDTTLDGTGVTVAITDAYAAKTIAKDANKYAVNNGDGSYAPGQFVETDAAAFTHKALCDPAGWAGEETLDVEAVHAMAPGANIHYYGAASCEDSDLLDALAQVDIDDTAQIVTNSWGDVEANESGDNVAAYEAVFLQGAIEGISFMFSSGDNGDELANTGIKQADYPTSDPYVTSVGGTSTAINQNGKIAFQTGWGTLKYTLSADGMSWNPAGFLYGSGGGTSALFNRPAYQASIGHGAAREIPDVAMDADPNTGMLVGETQQFPDGTYYDQYRIGGTSLASPLFAGLTALTIQNAGTGLGILNPTIYADSADFTDVKGTPKEPGDVRVDYANGVDASGGLLYSVRTFNQDSSLKIAKGWDNVTGLGTGSAAWTTAVAPAT